MDVANFQRLLWKLLTSEHDHENCLQLRITVEIANNNKLGSSEHDSGNCQYINITMTIVITEIANNRRSPWILPTSECHHGNYQHLNMPMEIANI